LASGLRNALATTDERLTGPRGTFGDMFGAVNALFAGLAFACVFYTILQQREHLRLQRQDLQLQREELKAARRIAIVAASAQARTTFVTAQVAAIRREGLPRPSART
jgi:hypothetical protein